MYGQVAIGKCLSSFIIHMYVLGVIMQVLFFFFSFLFLGFSGHTPDSAELMRVAVVQ